MRNIKRKTILASLVLLSCSVYAWETDQTYNFTILHTNDHHGRFWENDQGEYGLAAQKTLIDGLRQEIKDQGGTVLLLSGGDINTGVPESDLQNAEPDFKGMSLIGYDAMALGNHEFDNDLSVLKEQANWAGFPFLSANIYQKSTNQRAFQPYKIFDQQGVKIAVVGLTTDETVRLSNPDNLVDLEFRVPATEIKQVIDELRTTEKPDVVIAVTHMGHYDDGQHGSNAPGDVKLARSLPQGYLNMIVGGHSQMPVCMLPEQENTKQNDYVPGTLCQPDNQNDTWIVQAHEWGKYVGRADFIFKNGQLDLINYQLIPVNLMKSVKNEDGTSQQEYYTQKIEKDSEMLELLVPFQEKGHQQLGVKVGHVDGELEGDRSQVRFQQTNLARLILAGMQDRASADFAVMSGGGVRDSISSGDINYKDVLKVQPFGNELVYVDLTGEEALEYIESAVNMKPGSGAYAQFNNVSLILNDDGSISDVKIGGELIDPQKTYRLATLNFNAVGGDGYVKINNHPTYVNTGFVDAEILKAYIEKNSPLKANDFVPKGEIVDQRPR